MAQSWQKNAYAILELYVKMKKNKKVKPKNT